jgi:fibrillarin-like pre-rRNA processing protein
VETTAWEGVVRAGRELYTPNLLPGSRVHSEELRSEDGVEFRHWDPFRSKLAAFLLNGGADVWRGARSVLYLGGSHGTTASHLSDLLPDAEIFVVEKSPVSFAPLLGLSRLRPNLLPILADAQLPERYLADVGRVDLLYQDIAQRGQAAIFAENAAACLAPEGVGLLMLKVRSVTQARPGRAVVEEARDVLAAAGRPVRSSVDLAPFAREHVALLTGSRLSASTVRR